MGALRKIYISSVKGDDKNSGLSPDMPLKTLSAVNSMSLLPGDQILLECGSVFLGEFLHIKCSGTAEDKIVIDAYNSVASDRRPHICTNGNGIWYQNYGKTLDNPNHVYRGYVSSAILLEDAENIKISNLEISNSGSIYNEYFNQSDKLSRSGVAVIAKNRGTLHNIELENLFIHDVEGNIYDKHLNNGAIYFSALMPEDENCDAARFDNVHIHHCRIENCCRWGIAVGYTYNYDKFKDLHLDDAVVKKYGSTNVLIEHNYLKNIGGDGITPMYCYRPLVQYNVAENIATMINEAVYTEALNRGGMTAAAIWPWKCKDALFQYNAVYNTCFNQDGEAWDADSGDGTVYQFNYSCNNGGGCIMFCEGESVNNIFRYNISVNDGTGTITPVRNVDADVHNNIFYISKEVPFIRPGMSGGALTVRDNIIISASKKQETEDWHHQTEQAVYTHNLYCNYRNIPEDDLYAVVDDGFIERFKNLKISEKEVELQESSEVVEAVSSLFTKYFAFREEVRGELDMQKIFEFFEKFTAVMTAEN